MVFKLIVSFPVFKASCKLLVVKHTKRIDIDIENLSRKNKRVVTHYKQKATSNKVDASLLCSSTTLSSIALAHYYSLLISLLIPFHLFNLLIRTFTNLREQYFKLSTITAIACCKNIATYMSSMRVGRRLRFGETPLQILRHCQ